VITLDEGGRIRRGRWAQWKPWTGGRAGAVVAKAGALHVVAARELLRSLSDTEFSAYRDSRARLLQRDQIGPTLNAQLPPDGLEQKIRRRRLHRGGSVIATGTCGFYMNRTRLTEHAGTGATEEGVQAYSHHLYRDGRCPGTVQSEWEYHMQFNVIVP